MEKFETEHILKMNLITGNKHNDLNNWENFTRDLLKTEEMCYAGKKINV